MKLFKNLCLGDLSDLLSGDAEGSDEDSLSDLVAANMSEYPEDDENEFVIDSSVLEELNEGNGINIFLICFFQVKDFDFQNTNDTTRFRLLHTI